mmetsp:Transcript_36116/g.60883  ORF Transcript_36116/g.60883 Transcript_36116/m.60883 type:complete len:308 (-) Transcript_36116:375-1298(-)|eukprot:CAMPEP_0198212444 /NCGR_PEP_ID=MMETSP1445-20131203/26092_1 /TAXON_ID=36898 /ORGANISM="Pyramimonas sp., Strain CCMP2087" /LENGTH=307 /DNA_ID=CAMNT_0043886891 /DNA_START=340 /DNA_END=1263 /DNA_ORIENTATION=-
MTCNIFQHCKWLKVFGSLMVFVVTSLVAITAYAMIFIAYWDKLGKEDNHYGIPIVGVFLILAIMMLWSYFATLLQDPGSVPAGWQPSNDPSQDAVRRAGSHPAGARWCKRCLKWKPERCHHCSVCGRCVLKMDHHCVWVVNCVGGKNYKFFLLFLFYTFVVSVYSTVVLIPAFMEIFGYDNNDSDDKMNDSEEAFIFLAVVLDIAFAFSVAGFLAMHLTLVLSNTTTIEMYEKKRSSPWRYDLGRRKNFEQVFGDTVWHWPIPMHFDDDKELLDIACGLSDGQATLTLKGAEHVHDEKCGDGCEEKV